MLYFLRIGVMSKTHGVFTPSEGHEETLEDIMNVKLYYLRILLMFGVDRIIIR